MSGSPCPKQTVDGAGATDRRAEARASARSVLNTPGLARHNRGDLDAAALALNGRPRKTLAWKTPGEAFSEQLRFVTGSVATTP